MKSAIIPLIKNKTGDTNDKNNYRPIALVTAMSKIFELCLSEKLNDHLTTSDNQFGFKAKHSTDMCSQLQTRQTRPNSGGLQRAIQDSTKGLQ